MTTHPLTQAIESIENRVRSFNAERKQLAAELESVIASAQTLLSELGTNAGRGRPTATRRPGRPKGSTGARKRRRMSAAARKRISEAQKARWAKQKARDKK
jgi:hypothetical protein